jgi:DNA ligase (NAD+)
MNRIAELETKINQARDAYYNAQSEMDDDEFDALVYELSALDPKNKILAEVGAEPSTTEWKKEKHLFPLGSLNKVNTPKEMAAWITDNLQGKEVVVSEKLDGLSIGCQYDNGRLIRAILRGGGNEGENILANVLKMKGMVKKVSHNFTGVIRGEIVLLKDDHQKYFPDYANPRNAASGLCRRLDGEGCQHLTLMMYDVMSADDDVVGFETEKEKMVFLEDEGFILPNWAVVNNTAEVNRMWQDYQDNIRDSLNYEIDGLVVACNDLEFQQSLGETNLRPKGKMAFKFANQFAKTTIREVVWETGSMGRVNPVCRFEKTLLLGSTIEKASVYNIAYIEKLGLGEGAEVLVCKAGEIIPRVEKVVKKADIVAKAPTKCPSCDYPLVMNGEYLMCYNTDKCIEQVIGRIKNWVKELNILELGDKLIRKLVEEDLVHDPSDLYGLTVEQLSSLERMGKRSAEKVYAELWKVNPISLDVMIGGLSIALIGSSSIRLLMDAGYDNIDKLMGLSMAQMLAVKGMGEARSQSLYDGLKKNKKVIENLLTNGVKIMKKTEKKTGGKLDGKTFVLTGEMSRGRKEIAADIEAAGGVVQGSVNGKTNFLVQADPSSETVKTKKALAMGVKILGEEQLMGMINE